MKRYRIRIRLGPHSVYVNLDAPSEEAARAKAKAIGDGFVKRGSMGVLTRDTQMSVSRQDLDTVEGA